MTALTSARSVASAAAARISSWTWTLSAFIFGRSRRIVPMPPSTSSRTNSPIGSGLARRDGVLGQPGLEEEAHALEDVVDRQRHEDVEVGVRRHDVLGRDDEALLDERELDDVELHRQVVAAGEALVAVGRDGLGELPLAEEADKGEVTLGDAGEERRARALVVDDGELEVAVSVDARLDAEALQHVEDAVAHGRVTDGGAVGAGVGGARHEVGQRSRIGHAPTVTSLRDEVDPARGCDRPPPTLRHMCPPPPATPDLPPEHGVRLTAEGAQFSVYAGHARAVEVCLFDTAADGTETERRVPLRHRAHGTWFDTVPGVGAGQRYGFRVDGDWDPDRSLLHNPAKLLLDPYARAIEGGVLLDPAVYAHHVGPDLRGDLWVRDDRDSAPHLPRCVIVEDEFDWGTDG